MPPRQRRQKLIRQIVYMRINDKKIPEEIFPGRSQITDKSRKGVGFVSYNSVPPPPTGLFSPPKFDLSNSGLEEFQQDDFKGYGPKTSKSVSENISNKVRESLDTPLVEKLVLDDKLEKKTVSPTVAKIEFVRPKQQEKPVRKPVKTNSVVVNAVRANQGHPQKEDQGYVDSGCSRHMTGNMSYLSDFKEFNGGYVTFRGGAKGGKITVKETLKTGKLDFEDVYFVKELFLEDKPIIASDGPKWLFDIDVLTKSMNYVPVVTGTNSNDLVDGSLLYYSLKNASNDEPQPFSDAGKKDDEGVCKESGIVNQEKSKNSTQGVNTVGPSINTEPDMFSLGDNATLEATHADFFGDETEVEMSNITTTYPVPSTPNTRIHKDHSLDHDELLQFKLQKVWTLVDLPYGKRAIGTKWVYRNKKDERGIVDRNIARLVAQRYTQEEGIDYDEVFAPFARIEAIRLFLSYASFMNVVVYQMDVKSAFLYGKIEVEVYVCQPLGFEDPEFPDRVYKVEKALYGLHQAPKAWYETLYTKKELCTEYEKLMHKKVQISSMGELTFFLGLQVMQKEDGIFISQDKYVDEILKKIGFSNVRIVSTHMETSKPLLKDTESKDVDVHLYRSMIGSLMYLTGFRPDIIYLKGQPKLGLWYPKDSLFDLEAYSYSGYAGAIANSTTKAEYVAAANCCGQVLWIQNQMLDYGYNFMNTKIFIDNESTICIVKNLVFYSKTKHIEIRHHFIRDSYEKRLIKVIKIHTDHNVADLLTKAFDVSLMCGCCRTSTREVLQLSRRCT
ncbi:putative ribonuclease H-like domain-containing protein [Tanacetum coccineum]